MESDRYDAVVVGGGSGGLACAKAASRLGAKVALIEKAELGGTCVNRGCVPKKLLWEAGHAVLAQSRMAEMGVGGTPTLDFGRLRQRIDDKIAGLRATFEDDLAEAGVALLRGAAEIHGREDIRVDGRTLVADHLILATGASPELPGIDGRELLQTSTDVLSWTDVPGRIAILGGGYIGCEFAAIFSAFGSQVTLIEPADRLLSTFDAKLATHARRALENLGVTVLLERSPKSVQEAQSGYKVQLGDGTLLSADRVVGATGRRANVTGLGPVSAKLETAESGALAIDENFETSVPGIYAIGDAADRLPLTPVATRDGETLAAQLFGEWRAPVDLSLVATTAFLYPPHAQVGTLGPGDVITSEPLGAEVVIAKEKAEDADFFRLAFDGDRLSGAALAAAGAGDIIAAFGSLISARASRDDLGAATGVHPTAMEEIIGR